MFRQPIRRRLLGAAELAANRLGRPADTTNRNALDNRHLGLLLVFSLEQSSNCIDVGAHGGEVLAEMRRIAPLGHHIAFEPLPRMAAKLRSRFPDADIRECALSDTRGEATDFVEVLELPELSGLRAREYGAAVNTQTITVRVETLDEALPTDYVPDLIKIDVEGNELGVLRGGRTVLAAHHPIIAFEHGSGAAEHYGTTSGDVHDLLVRDLEYRVFDIDGRGPLSRYAFEGLFSEPIWNFVARV